MENLKTILNRKSYRAPKGAESMTGMLHTKAGMKLADDVKVPALKSNQVLIRVHYASLNFADTKKPVQTTLPGFLAQEALVGFEFCGTIERLGWQGGDKVHLFKDGIKGLGQLGAIGDVVFGLSYGSIGEFVVCDAERISFKPDNMAEEQAASFPYAGLTAYQALTFNKFSSGKTILVLGAADPTGIMFMKQARLMGAEKVIGVCTPEQEDFVASVGADQVLDFQSFLEAVPECDLVVDLMTNPDDKKKKKKKKKNKDKKGKKAAAPVEEEPVEAEAEAAGGEGEEEEEEEKESSSADVEAEQQEEEEEEEEEPEEIDDFYKACKPLLKTGARVVTVNFNVADEIRKLLSEQWGFNIEKPGFDAALVKVNKGHLEQLAKWFEQGLLEMPVDSVLELKDEQGILEAYEKIKAHQVNGKVVVRCGKSKV